MKEFNKILESSIDEAFQSLTPEQKKAAKKYSDAYGTEIEKEIRKFVKDNGMPSRMVNTITSDIIYKIK